MATLLLLNGHELMSPIDDAEAVILGVASGSLQREDFESWVARSIRSTSL
jgi:prophage maintenance system killer protein